MVLKEDLDIILVVVVGTLTISSILIGLFAYIFTFQKKFSLQQSKHQKELLNAMVLAQELERKNLSRDLHDGIGASLSIVKMKVSNIKKTAQHLTRMTL
ncbi:MAG: hypothetical protein H0X62_14720 [Bacteroidetes bacterium]|nr:hypothetical protein [Bacteroidota bacterium]